MGAKEDLDALFPDGIKVTEEEAEALVIAAQEGGKNLPEKDYQANKKAFLDAIAANDKEKEILTIIKFGLDLGLSIKNVVA